MDATPLTWRTSTFSSENANCVEFARLPDGDVAIRDTKDRTRPAHRYPATQWTALLDGVRAGTFDIQ